MALNEAQIELVKEFYRKFRDFRKEYSDIPEEVEAPFKELWQGFKEIAEFDDDNQADLAAFGALVQFSTLMEAFPPEKFQEVLSLFSTIILKMIKKGDRKD